MSPGAQSNELPFSARYSIPLNVSEGLGEVSWDTVARLSTEFQLKTEEKQGKVKKVLKELQLTRLLLMDKIRHGSRDGRIDPKLLVEIVRLIQRCESISEEYGLDLKEFSSFLFLISEKLKKEKLARHCGQGMAGIVPIKEELDDYKTISEGWRGKAGGMGRKGKDGGSAKNGKRGK